MFVVEFPLSGKFSVFVTVAPNAVPLDNMTAATAAQIATAIRAPSMRPPLRSTLDAAVRLLQSTVKRARWAVNPSFEGKRLPLPLLRRAARRRNGARLGHSVRVGPADRDGRPRSECEERLAHVHHRRDRSVVQRGDDVAGNEPRRVG